MKADIRRWTLHRRLWATALTLLSISPVAQAEGLWSASHGSDWVAVPEGSGPPATPRPPLSNSSAPKGVAAPGKSGAIPWSSTPKGSQPTLQEGRTPTPRGGPYAGSEPDAAPPYPPRTPPPAPRYEEERGGAPYPPEYGESSEGGYRSRPQPGRRSGWAPPVGAYPEEGAQRDPPPYPPPGGRGWEEGYQPPSRQRPQGYPPAQEGYGYPPPLPGDGYEEELEMAPPSSYGRGYGRGALPLERYPAPQGYDAPEGRSYGRPQPGRTPPPMEEGYERFPPPEGVRDDYAAPPSYPREGRYQEPGSRWGRRPAPYEAAPGGYPPSDAQGWGARGQPPRGGMDEGGGRGAPAREVPPGEEESPRSGWGRPASPYEVAPEPPAGAEQRGGAESPPLPAPVVLGTDLPTGHVTAPDLTPVPKERSAVAKGGGEREGRMPSVGESPRKGKASEPEKGEESAEKEKAMGAEPTAAPSPGEGEKRQNHEPKERREHTDSTLRSEAGGHAASQDAPTEAHVTPGKQGKK